jgi:hypothetical protein
MSPIVDTRIGQEKLKHKPRSKSGTGNEISGVGPAAHLVRRQALRKITRLLALAIIVNHMQILQQ